MEEVYGICRFLSGPVLNGDDLSRNPLCLSLKWVWGGIEGNLGREVLPAWTTIGGCSDHQFVFNTFAA